MKYTAFSSRMVRPPSAVRNARLDNLALVPASLLLRKGQYQPIANQLPRGGVLICQTETKQRIAYILTRVADWLREQGHVVRVLVVSAKSGQILGRRVITRREA